MATVTASSIEEIRHQLKQGYGVDMGVTGALLVTIVREEAAAQRAIIDQASQRINQANTPLQTDKPIVAFLYGVGKGLPMAIVVSVVAYLVFSLYTHRVAYKQAEQVISTAKLADIYRFLMKDGKLSEGNQIGLSEGVYLTLNLPEKDAALLVGHHFIIGKGGKTIHVPLLFD